MPHTLTKTVFYFDELSDKAKDKAREWFREASQHDEWWDYVYEDFERVAKILGVTFKQNSIQTMGGITRGEPAIYFSGFWSQGDGACFEGTYEYAKGCAKVIRSYAPQDTELHHIADGLTAVQKNNRYRLTATVAHRGNYYSHSNSTDIDVFTGDGYEFAHGDTTEVVTRLLRDFMDWMYRQLQTEYEYRNSNEVVDDNIRANEYEFDENGHRSV